MPFEHLSKWEEQFFKDIPIPRDVTIPVDDTAAYLKYPNLRWIFNKLELCKTQGITAAPVGVTPELYPVFTKPITNLYGMGIYARRVDREEDLCSNPGFFWMEYLEPPHVSTDVVLEKGVPKWWGHTLAHKIDDTRFDMWEFRGNTRFELLEKYITDWVKNEVGSFTGVFNFETLNGKIIDAHPRMSVQFVDLYGNGWLNSVVDLYCGRGWHYSSTEEIGYSAPIWSNDFIELKMDNSKLCTLASKVLSIQITSEDIYQPPTGFRVAIVNGRDKESVLDVVREIEDALERKDPSWWEFFRVYKKKTEVEELIGRFLPPREDKA